LEQRFDKFIHKMRLVRTIAVIVLAGWSISATAQVATEPQFHFEIQSSGIDSPKFSVTNLSTKTLVACTISVSVSTESRPQTKMNWNQLVRAGQGSRNDGQGPLEPGKTLTLNLPRVVGGPLPDKIEVIAGIWADGETFGQPTWIKVLMEMNASMVSAYEQAIALLKEGIENNWTREQYLAALESKPESLPFYSMRQTFQANQALDQHPQLAKNVAQSLSHHFEQDLQLLRPQKAVEPVPSAPAILDAYLIIQVTCEVRTGPYLSGKC
jgi:hypothetical protein